MSDVSCIGDWSNCPTRKIVFMGAFWIIIELLLQMFKRFLLKPLQKYIICLEKVGYKNIYCAVLAC